MTIGPHAGVVFHNSTPWGSIVVKFPTLSPTVLLKTSWKNGLHN